MKAARAGAGGRGAVLAEAFRQLNDGRPARAAQVLGKLLQASPDDPDALHYLGVAQYQLGDYDPAIASLNKAVGIAPDYAEAHNSLGTIHLEAQRHSEAAACFRRAVELRPDYANAFTNLGNALRDGGDLEPAAGAYREAIRLDPMTAQPAYRLAASLISLNQPAEALEAIEACLRIEPWCQNALASKGIALQMVGEDALARRLHDFARFVTPVEIEPPAEYGSAAAFNAALAKAVHDNPSLTWEPLNRVTRKGAVTQDMLVKPAKPIRQFEQALRQAIDAHRESLTPEADHPFLNRIPERYRLTFIASILTEGGWHPSHIHESAWLSGVYYVDVPPAVSRVDGVTGESAAAGGRGGWLEFGRPDYPLPEGFEPFTDSYQPAAGLARFFPSYFFHGTIPFRGGGERIGIAFDAYPVQ